MTDIFVNVGGEPEEDETPPEADQDSEVGPPGGTVHVETDQPVPIKGRMSRAGVV